MVASSTCIYCGSAGPFNEEHPLPRCLGEFREAPPIQTGVCKTCNGEIGRAEEQFCRAGPEAFFRQYYDVSGRASHNRVNPFERGSAGAPAIDYKAIHSGLGIEILWELNPGEETVREVRQIVVVDTEGKAYPIRVTQHMTTSPRLKAQVDVLGVSPKEIYVFAQPEEIEWVNSLVTDIASGVTWSSGQPGKQVVGARAKTEVGENYFRSLTKIGLHYLIATSDQVTGAETEFDPVRAFIQHGGDPNVFFKEEQGVIIDRDSPLARPERPIHIVTVEWTPKWVASRMQSFFGPDYEPPIYLLRLAPGVSKLPGQGALGHAYVYFEDGPEGKFAGDVSEIITRRK
ncbi:MAG: hypothetical protein GKR89_30835 [Candidatus Latescibacteria bacterium]|nr:hypothetical protein [Candidatus Latescibacterota bacterium]